MIAQKVIRVRLFGVLGAQMGKTKERIFPFSPNLTVGLLWSTLKSTSEPVSYIRQLHRDAILALVNGRPIHLLNGWETHIEEDDTVTYLLKAFGG